jgi:hypothetical protein
MNSHSGKPSCYPGFFFFAMFDEQVFFLFLFIWWGGT